MQAIKSRRGTNIYKRVVGAKFIAGLVSSGLGRRFDYAWSDSRDLGQIERLRDPLAYDALVMQCC